MKGWCRLTPPRSRVGVVYFVIAAIAAKLVEMNCWWMAVWVLLGHGGYLRPSSIMRLQGDGFIPPVPADCPTLGLLLNPSSWSEGSKTGAEDDALMWDVEELVWLTPVFAWLWAKFKGQVLFQFTYAQLAEQVKRAAARLGSLSSRTRFVTPDPRVTGSRSGGACTR